MWKLIVLGTILVPKALPGATRHDKRNAILMEMIKKHGVIVQHPIRRDTNSTRDIPPGGSTFSVMDASGRQQQCTLQRIRDENSTTAKNKTVELNIVGSPCRTISQGYWSYSWCHRKEVTQFHTDRFGQVEQLWSLGKFLKTIGLP